jgi:hypothetical protein
MDKEYMGYGSELDKEILDMLKENKEENKMLTTTANVVPTIADGGYYGYGRGGAFFDKANYDLNLQNLRDTLDNKCKIESGTLAVTGNTNLRMSEAQTEANFRQLATDNKIDAQSDSINARLTQIEQNIFKGQVDTLNRQLILEGQKVNRLEHQLNDFCCPKPSARYEVVGCPPCNNGNGNNITINDIITLINASRPGNS